MIRGVLEMEMVLPVSGFLIGSVSGYTLGRTIETRVLGGK